MDTVLFAIGSYQFTVPAASSLAAGIVTLLLGVSVLIRERRAEESLYFLFFCIVVFIWLLSFGFMYASPDREAARDWMHAGYMAIPFVPAVVYRFTVQILGSNPRRRLVMGGIWAIAAFLVILFVGVGVFTEGMVRREWGWIDAVNRRGFVVIAYIAVAVGASLAEYAVAIRAEADPRRRRALILMLVGFGIGGLALVDYLPALGIEAPPFGYLPLLVGLLVLAHVVQRHSLVELTPSFTADAILRTMTDPVLVVDGEGTIRFASEAVRPTFGREADDLVGEPVHVLAVDGAARGALDRLLEADDPVDGEVRFLSRRGEEMPAAVFASPVSRADGGREGTVLIVKDLRVREEARRAVEAVEEKYGRLFELNPMAIGVATRDGSRFLEVNESFERFFGVSREVALAEGPTGLDLWVDPNERTRILDRIREGSPVEGQEVRLRAADGEVREVLFFADGVELDGVPAMMAMAHDITDRKAFERELERRALYDGLTELPNRSLLRDRLVQALERARREGVSVGVLFVDLDRFKVVNDSMGHAAGDEVLRRAAHRFREAVRGEDTVARVGGDEFVVLLERVRDPADVELAAERMVDRLAAPIQLESQAVHLSASVGIALSGPDEDDTADELLRRADVAMYRAKHEAGVDVHVFDPATDRSASERLQRENDLRRAIEEDELVVHYQPFVSLQDGRVVGAEALVRWDRPGVGVVPPADFIPLAEETGLIVPMGEWVIRRALADAADWAGKRPPEAGTPDERPPDERSFVVSVNLSARQYHAGGIEAAVEEALEATGLPAESLQLEITESVLMENPERLEPLRARGVQLAIDDFGTGYSSFRYLHQFPVDVLKVDRSFVSGLATADERSVIVKAILMIGRQLGMEVVAEGIETEAERTHLVELGCRRGQGFLFGRAMPADAFGRMVEEGVAPAGDRRS